MGSQPTTTELMERNKALAAELADYKEMVDQYRIDHPKVEARAKALEADRDQISLTLAVAKADRDKWFNRSRALEAALRGARDTLREIEPIVKHEYSLNRIRISEKECVAALATSETGVAK